MSRYAGGWRLRRWRLYREKEFAVMLYGATIDARYTAAMPTGGFSASVDMLYAMLLP